MTSQYLSEEDYNTLEFPYNQTAFLDFAVVKNRSSCAGWKEQLQSKIQEVDIGFQYKEIDSRQYCLLDRMEHSYIKIRGERFFTFDELKLHDTVTTLMEN